MKTRRKRASRPLPPPPATDTFTAVSPVPSSRKNASSLAHADSALDECVGAICLVEVTMHSLASQELASPEQEVLRRALKAIWFVHDWIDELRSHDLKGNDADGEGAL